jgi:hypothetical protein
VALSESIPLVGVGKSPFKSSSKAHRLRFLHSCIPGYTCYKKWCVAFIVHLRCLGRSCLASTTFPCRVASIKNVTELLIVVSERPQDVTKFVRRKLVRLDAVR